MIHIDLPADLNFEDDEGLLLARVPASGQPAVGAVLIAGSEGGWTWAIVVDVADGWVRYRPVSAKEAARHGRLVAS